MLPQVFAAMSAIASPQLDAVMLLITKSYPVVLLLLLAYFSYSNNVNLYPLALALLLSFSTVILLKPLFNEARPCTELSGIHAIGCEASKSFPSGHATLVFTALPFFARAPMYAYATLVGISRIYLGQHYLTDVIAGAILGLAVGYACLRKKDWLIGKMQTIRKKL